MLNFYTAADAIVEENDVRKQARAERSNEPIHSRYCAKGNRVAKVTTSGRFEEMEEEVGVRSRTELTDSMSDLKAFMGESKKIGAQTFIVGEAAAKEAKPVQPQRLPTARVFRLRRDGKSRELCLVYKD